MSMPISEDELRTRRELADLPSDQGNRESRLPNRLTSFIGRDRDVAHLADLLPTPEIRLVTLIGAGGVGKTRLAIEAARLAATSFVHGAVFIDLTPLSDASLVDQALAQGVGVKTPAEMVSVDVLSRALRDVEALLVLDNFEHVIDAASNIGRLLETTRGLTLLITSREPLRLSAEQVVPVQPLVLPGGEHTVEDLLKSDSGRLFVERSRAASGAYPVTETNAPTIAAICARLDGLPLAIELAAARASHLSPSILLSKLERRLPLLTGGARDAPARQQTLRDAIAWSYELLSSEERSLFSRLAVFVGGFTLEAAEAVAHPEDSDAAVVDGIRALVSKSLLCVDEDLFGFTRYRMLETIREFALEQLAARADYRQIRELHATYFLHQTREADELLLTTAHSMPQYLQRTEHEHANLRQALAFFEERGDTPKLMELACSMARFWYSQGWFREGISVFQAALDRGDDAPPDVTARVMSALANFYGEAGGNVDIALDLSSRSVSKARDVGDLSLLVDVLGIRGIVLRGARLVDDAIVALEEAVALGQAHGHEVNVAIAKMNLGAALFDRGEHERGISLVAEATAVCRDFGADSLAALGLARLGRIAQVNGDTMLAAARYGESLRLSWRARTAVHYDRVLVGIAGLAVDRGLASEAARLLGIVEAIQEQTGATSLMWPEERERAAALARARLGDDAFDREIAAGRRFSPASVESMALNLADAFAASASRETVKRSDARPYGLSERELEVLRLLAIGQSDRAIAESLFLSPRTVNTHVTHIFQKLGAHSRAEAALMAQRADLLEE